MLACRSWRRERDKWLKDVTSKKIRISARKDEKDLQRLFLEEAVEGVLQLLDSTAVGMGRATNDMQKVDG